MKIALIAALSRNRVIGREGKLPWRFAADLRHFKKITLGHPILAGRRTFESFQRRPLPGRLNLVLSRDPAYQAPAGALVFHALEEARAYCESIRAEKLFVVGGEELYRQTLPIADELILTHIPQEVEGDAFFPEWDESEWEEIDSREEEGLRFVTYRRKSA